MGSSLSRSAPLFVLALVACKGGDDPARVTASASTSEPAAASVAAPTASASAAAASRVPAFKEVARLGKDAILFDVGARIIGCEDRCQVPADPAKPMPKLTVVDASGSHEEPSLSIEGAHGVPRKKLAEDNLRGLEVRYYVGRDDALFAGYWYDHQGEGGYSRYDLPVRRDGAKWVVAQFEGPSMKRAPDPGPDLDEARAHAPWKSFASAGENEPWFHTLVFGSGGAPVEVRGAELARWDGKAWAKSAAPWKTPRAIERLANGTTIVLADGRAWIWADGAPEPIALAGAAPDRALELHTVDGARWLAARDGDALRVYAPLDPAAMKQGPLEEPKGPPTVPRGGDPMPAATGASPGCATPFVIISSAKNATEYPLTRDALVGHAELQDALTFVEFDRDEAVYFGAQAKRAEDADQLVAILKEKVKGMKPVLGCLDAKAHLEGQARAAGARRIVLNLATGEWIGRR